MSKKIIYSYFSADETRFIVDYLSKEYSWHPAFFHGRVDMKEWINKKYSNAIFRDSNDLRKACFDYSGLGNVRAIDSEILNCLSEFESTYLNWLEDSSGWNFSFLERRNYYHDILKFWNTVILNMKPDLLITYTWPHLPSDYPLYLLCKYYYKIPVLFFDPIPFLDSDYYTIGSSLENLSSPFIKEYTSDDNGLISEPVQMYLSKLRSKGVETPWHVKKYLNELDNNNNSNFELIRNFIRLLKNRIAFKEGESTFKKNMEPWSSEKSKMTHFDYLLFRSKLQKSVKRLTNYYNSYIKNVDYKKKYIYFAAPYQPEAISNLMAGSYENIFIIIDMLSEILPEGWYIYYKEHPNTFKTADKGALERSKQFYDKLVSYKSLIMISHTTSTFDLIDNSKAVCTVGGTVGWEAVVRGKPALVYGSLWYQACNSIFTIKNSNEAKRAITKILNGFTPDDKDVDRYAEAIYNSTTKGLIRLNDFTDEIKSIDSPSLLMEKTAKAFFDAYNKFYS